VIDRYGCQHPNFDDGGVCTACKEFYSAEHDKHPDDIHPAMKRLIERAARSIEEKSNEQSTQTGRCK
jgi:hypothetical protein